VPVPTWVIKELQNMSVLLEQSGSTPDGQYRVAVLVKLNIRLTVSSESLGLVKVIGTDTKKVMVTNPSSAGTLDITVQLI
jgi:hypothetical protein